MARFAYQQSDPFICSSDRAHDDYLLTVAMHARNNTASDLLSAYRKQDLKELAEIAISAGPWEGAGSSSSETARAITSTRGEVLRRDAGARLTAAFIAGLFLLGPMWALTLKSQEVFLQLGVTSGCVSAFGLLMAWILPTSEAVFAATLAYAAVLMVFVGVVMQSLQS